MNLAEAQMIIAEVERSRVPEALRRQWLEAAVRYAELRVAWWLAAPADRSALDPSRTAAHDAFIDACNILSRAMASAGESNAWRRAIGAAREDIGDLACLLHGVLGLRAR